MSTQETLDQISHYSNFREMYQGTKEYYHSMDDAKKIHVQRDVLGKVLSIDWIIEGETDTTRRREFEYFNDGLLSILTDKINGEVTLETIFGGNEFGLIFFEYIFL